MILSPCLKNCKKCLLDKLVEELNLHLPYHQFDLCLKVEADNT